MGSRLGAEPTSRWTNRIEYWILILVVLAGFILRTWQINFDQGVGSHPDERSTACFVAPTIGWPQSWEEFRDPRRSPLNPLWNRGQGERRSFTYGHFPLYFGVAMGHAMHWVTPHVAPAAAALGISEPTRALWERANRACDGIAVAGRLTIALLDTVTIVLVFLLARAIFGVGLLPTRASGRWFALLAAAFYAFTAQAIQLSHFFAMDPASTTFTVMAVLGGVYMVQRRSLASALVCGVGAGLAIASKFSALPILAVPVVAALLILRESVYQSTHGQGGGLVMEGRGVPGAAQFFALTGVLAAFLAAAASFALTSPYAILDWQSFIQATLVEQGRMVRGVADFPFTRQYRGTTPYLYFIQQQVAWGMWWPLGLAAVAGSLGALGLLVVSLVRYGRTMVGLPSAALTRAEIGNVVIWAWVLPYFGLTGAFLAKFNRYMSPLLPFLCLFAAGLLWGLWVLGRRQAKGGDASFPGSTRTWPALLAKSLAMGLAVLVLAGSLFWSLAYVNGVYGREHTWITASRWIYDNAPPGSVILWELWDDPLPLRAMPDDPATNLGSAELRNIDWSPYEEDTFDKYLLMRERLREADYVAYSSKRIYGSVIRLPQRYPMTIRYYEGMWDGSLGFEIAVDVTTPPRLFGWEFDDRHADESWSLYDHPRATVFRKTRDLTDAEFDAYFERAWEQAIPYHRGEDSVLSPLLELIGLGQTPGSEGSGVLGRITRILSGDAAPPRAPARIPDLMLAQSPAALPIVDNYRWNAWASAQPWRAAAVWWLALWGVGAVAWPLLFGLFSGLRDRGYFLGRTAGWLAAGWLLWAGASVPLWHNTVRNVWLALLGLTLVSAWLAWRQRTQLIAFLRAGWPVLLLGEAVFLVVFVLFLQFRVLNPDLWQPWHGGEKFMEFAFLNGVLRSPTFPPVNPHFAGGYINYYYYGLYLVGYLIKLTGIYAEIAFNLAVASLFALTALNAFGIVYNVARAATATARWRTGVGAGLLAALFVVGIGNLEAFAQLIRNVMRAGSHGDMAGIFGFVPMVVGGLGQFALLITQGGPLPAYDFWGPSRVIPNTINEFPFWTFLFADLHPHMIVLPFCFLLLAAIVQLLSMDHATSGRIPLRSLVIAGVVMGFVVGGLASINLWEYPTYLGLTLLCLLLLAAAGRISWWASVLVWGITAGASYLFYLPFFAHYVGVGASGIGLVREPDALGTWLLIWGFFLFVLGTWMIWRIGVRPGARAADGWTREAGISRLARLGLRGYDRLPRLAALHILLVRMPTFGYLVCLTASFLATVGAIVAFAGGRLILGTCIVGAVLSMPLLARASLRSERAVVFGAICVFTGFLILGGTQVVYVRDFLQGGDWYRMNTLFKFFVQVWVLWGIAAGIGFVQLWHATRPSMLALAQTRLWKPAATTEVRAGAVVWRSLAMILLLCTLAYPLFGTPARLAQRMVGWRPPVGTLDGMAFMEQGSYTWPDDSHRIELRYDHDAIRWLLENVRGNLVIAEAAEVDYYRAGGTRVASFTGLSGLMGKHENEQRAPEQVAQRHRQMREFWDTSDLNRTLDLAQELEIALVYVGQLERHQHPTGVEKMHELADMGLLTQLYANDGVTIYAFPQRVAVDEHGVYTPVYAPMRDVG